MKLINVFFVAFIILISTRGSSQTPVNESKVPADSLLEFELQLDSLRRYLKIPALSAAVVKDNEIIWANGFGYADLEKQVKATDSTAYRVASITKTYASTIIMQLVNEGILDLEAPISEYGINLKSKGIICVKHLLSHTSQYKPGEVFRYSGARFGYLEEVIKDATGKSFGELLIERIIIPLSLRNTAPSLWTDSTFYPETTNLFPGVHQRLAKPYRLRQNNTIAKSNYIMGFMVAGGLVTTVHDMAAYNIALDTNFFFDELTSKRVYSPFISTKGDSLPYGLGWFVQDSYNLRILWHYGWHPDAASSLIIKVPEKRISFMIFANTDMLSKPFSLHNGNVLNSPAAIIFLKTYLPEEFKNPGINEKENELKEVVLKSAGNVPLISRLQSVLLNICLLIFVSAIIFWPLRLIAIKLFPLRLKAVQKEGLKGFLFRFYLFVICLLCLFFSGVLRYYPPLLYWHEFSGWFDGIPLYQNLSLALPSIISVLSLILIPIILYIWVKKTWNIKHRVHYSIIVLSVSIYLILLKHWHLIGIGYYWKYFINNL